jgi:hypothetical protein
MARRSCADMKSRRGCSGRPPLLVWAGYRPFDPRGLSSRSPGCSASIRRISRLRGSTLNIIRITHMLQIKLQLHFGFSSIIGGYYVFSRAFARRAYLDARAAEVYDKKLYTEETARGCSTIEDFRGAAWRSEDSVLYYL